MYISRNWLKDFVKIPDSLSAKELGLKLTMAMAEVEGFVDQRESLQGVVVGEILEVKKHPNADKLKLAVVDVKDKKLNIVCGAPNIAKGQKVPVALVGTKLASGMEIAKAKVRGEVSEGMLCAEDELGLGPDHSGILILDPKLVTGTSLAKALGLADIVYEIDNKSLTHRPDLWSHYGVARETAAILGEKLESYKVKNFKDGREKLDIRVEDFKLCPRYMGVVIEGIKIEESPDWLKRRVEAVGMRSINNIVDITNYVMMEIGQPLHAFDYDKLEGQRIIVRSAKPGEKIKTLDDENRKLDEEILVIADAKQPVAIAGVMGGANTEIDNQTEKIIIESANFDHVSIRKTSDKLGLRTEASIRFEKSLDPSIAEFGIKKAIELILQLCPEAKIVSRIEDVKKFKLNHGPIEVGFDFINKRIGQQIDEKKVIGILTSLGFEVKRKKTGIEVFVPTWRATKDVSIPEDIVEEVARIFGYDNLEVVMPEVNMERPEINKERELEHKIKNILAYGFDMTEVYNYSFNSLDQIKSLGLDADKYIKVANPLSKETELVRRSLIPNLLDNMVLNNRFYDDIGLFEIGSTYLKEQKGFKISDKTEKYLPLQEKWLAGILQEKKNDQPFYIAKNIVAALLSRLHLDYKLVKTDQVPAFAKKSRAVRINIKGKDFGYIAELDDSLYKKLDLEIKLAFFEFNLTQLVEIYSDEIKYKEIPKFPSIDLDISMIINKKILWEEVEAIVRGTEKELVRKVTFFDVYEGKGIPAGKKSIAFRIEYRSNDKTLTMDEVQIIHNKVIKNLENKIGGQIRK